MSAKCLPGQAHHWKIALARGRTSKGVCVHCKAEKEFINSIEFEGRVHISIEKPPQCW